MSACDISVVDVTDQRLGRLLTNAAVATHIRLHQQGTLNYTQRSTTGLLKTEATRLISWADLSMNKTPFRVRHRHSQVDQRTDPKFRTSIQKFEQIRSCLLYTSDAADE